MRPFIQKTVITFILAGVWVCCFSATPARGEDGPTQPAHPEAIAPDSSQDRGDQTAKDTAAEPSNAASKADQEGTAAAPSDDHDVGELSKQTQNPVSDLITVPFSWRFSFNGGPKGSTQQLITAKPVYPVRLSDKWTLISRTIVPYIIPGDSGSFVDESDGLGDIAQQFFLTPTKPGKLIWGVGPMFTFPTATTDYLGAGKWSAGPTAVVLGMEGKWVYGALVTHQWSFAGDDEFTATDRVNGVKVRMTVDRPDTNVTTLQPFVNYNLPHGWALGSGPTFEAHWDADSGDEYLIPMGVSLSKTFIWGKQPMQVAARSYYNVIRPDAAPEWYVEFGLTFLFPKSKSKPATRQATVPAEPETTQ